MLIKILLQLLILRMIHEGALSVLIERLTLLFIHLMRGRETVAVVRMMLLLLMLLLLMLMCVVAIVVASPVTHFEIPAE